MKLVRVLGIDRRSTLYFYFVCEQHLAELFRCDDDACKELYKQDHGTPCDANRCPLPADFEYYPGLNRRIKSIKVKDLVTREL